MLERKAPFIILSIDGGGVRGAIPAAFLACLERDLGVPLTSHFDYFAGTSAGGLLALYMGGKGASAEQAAELFSAPNAQRIFDKSLLDRIVPSALQPGPKYDGTGKAEVLEEVFGLSRMRYAPRPTLITAYDPAEREFVAFKSHGGGNTNENPLMWQVADATSAAPVYFPPARVSGATERILIDGGIGANNPAMAAIAEAIKAGIPTDDIVVLSLGTGQPEVTDKQRRAIAEKSSTWGGVDWLRHGIIDHALHAAADASDYWASQICGDRYVRIQSDIAPDLSELDNASCENLERLRGIGEQWYADNRERVLSVIAPTIENTLAHTSAPQAEEMRL